MITTRAKTELESYLREDVNLGDVTSSLLPRVKAKAIIIARETCFLSGIEEISYLLRKHGLKVKALKKDGEKIKRNQKVLEIVGENRTVLSLERICLNVLGRMSGVTTLCNKAKKKCKNTRLAVTRKTMPGFQLLDKKAAEVAGLWSHRKDLSEMILIKENHLEFIGIKEAIRKGKNKNKKVEIEVENQKQALEASTEQPFMIMLDNFSAKNAKISIGKLKNAGFKGKIELSGGITIKNLSRYCNLGADIISMGELTKKANIIDFSLRVL